MDEVGDVKDYISLLKPRVMSLVVFTAFVGMVLAPGGIHPVFGFVALLCIAIGAGASGALNMWYDADIDALMARTLNRPIPSGAVPKSEALTFGTVLSIGSVLVLGVVVNWMAAFLLAFTILYYVLFYTMWLKRRTAQNIVIGGAAGAFPPVVGWASVTGSISIDSIILFLIIFIWTPPHFWALALYRSKDYEKASIPMLPVTAGPVVTRRHIWLYTLVLIPVTFLPVVTGLADALYLITAMVAGGIFTLLAWRVYQPRKNVEYPHDERQLFKFSIFYLFLLYAVLLIEHSMNFRLIWS